MRWLPVRLLLLYGMTTFLGISPVLGSAQGGACELVEIQVGYPGYRGFVTGVDGIGDHACLEDLESEDATFDKRHEDRENREAAKALGISGRSDSWTWENWLLIEAERGLSPTCYWCAFSEAADRSEPRNTEVDWDDPRLQCGEVGSFEFSRKWRTDHGYNAGIIMQDYELRSLAMLSTRNGYINAEEIIALQSSILEGLYESTGGQYIDARWVWDELVARGGAFEVPSGLTADDQVFVFYLGVLGLESSAGERGLNILYSLLESAHYDWIRSGMTVSWKDYLQQIGAEDWF